MIMMISEEKVAEFKEQDDSLKNLVYWLKTNWITNKKKINAIYEDIFQRVFEGERTHWHLKQPRESNSHFKVGTNHKEQVAIV